MPAVVEGRIQLSSSAWQGDRILIWKLYSTDAIPFKSWKKATAAAGVPGKIPHDFRRTAVRNLERAGVPRSVAMKLAGHKTESIYRRYAIVARQDLVDGLKRLAEHRAGLDKTPAEQKVVEIKEAAR